MFSRDFTALDLTHGDLDAFARRWLAHAGQLGRGDRTNCGDSPQQAGRESPGGSVDISRASGGGQDGSTMTVKQPYRQEFNIGAIKLTTD